MEAGWDAGASVLAIVGAVFGYGKVRERQTAQGETLTAHDKRLTKLEDAFMAVGRIEEKVNSIHENQEHLPCRQRNSSCHGV